MGLDDTDEHGYNTYRLTEAQAAMLRGDSDDVVVKKNTAGTGRPVDTE